MSAVTPDDVRPDDPAAVEWARMHWAMLAEGGIWGLPRSGLTFRKLDGRLVLLDRMPWSEGMPLSQEELREYQDDDFAGVRLMYAQLGIEVVEA
jgi:IMP dehydrogenase/GMP reductase